MANWYVRSGAGGTASGADWTNAKLTIAAACTASAAGDTIYVSEDHAESSASAITIACPGSVSNPSRILCVNHAGSVPPVSADLTTGGSVTESSTNNITLTGSFYCYGLTFASANTAQTAIICASASNNNQVFDNCKFNPTSATSTGGVSIGTSGNASMSAVWNNCTLKTSHITQTIIVNEKFIWKNSATPVDTGGSVPTVLLLITTVRPGSVLLEGLDFSAVAITRLGNGGGDGSLLVKDCKLNASTAVGQTPTNPGNTWVDFMRCATSGNVLSGRYRYQGTQTTELTIFRTGGASDGTTAVSNKIVTTANSKVINPFEAMPIEIWNDVSGSAVTVTIYGIWGGGAVPNNDDIWFDLAYLGSSSGPNASFATCGKADVLASNAAHSSDSSTWGGSTTKFKMAVTATPQQKGVMYVYVKAATASTTFYIDPLPVLT